MITCRLRHTPREWPKSWARLSRELPQAVHRGFRKAGRFGVQSLALKTGHQRKVAVTRQFVEGWAYAYNARSKSLTYSNAAPYAWNIENGRRAGAKPPPVAALREWCRLRLGNANLAYPVARAISRRGIKATRNLTAKRQLRVLRAILWREVSRELSQYAAEGKAIARSIQRFVEGFPEQVEVTDGT